MSFSDGDALLSERDAGEYLSQPFGAVRRQLDGHCGGVDNPP